MSLRLRLTGHPEHNTQAKIFGDCCQDPNWAPLALLFLGIYLLARHRDLITLKSSQNRITVKRADLDAQR